MLQMFWKKADKKKEVQKQANSRRKGNGNNPIGRRIHSQRKKKVGGTFRSEMQLRKKKAVENARQRVSRKNV